MDDGKTRSHEDTAHRDDKSDERLNPGQNTGTTGGAGARPAEPQDHPAAKDHPLDRSDATQAGTQRDPSFKPEDADR